MSLLNGQCYLQGFEEEVTVAICIAPQGERDLATKKRSVIGCSFG